MKFYEEEFIPEDLRPDWDYWNRQPILSLEELSFLCFDVDHNNYGIDSDINSDILSHIQILFRLFNSWVKEGSIAEIPLDVGVTIRVVEFIELLEERKIPYPKAFTGVEQKTTKKTSKGKNISKTIVDNSLKRLFNQVVKLHFGTDVTAYKIAQHIQADEKTIKKYLD